LEKVYKLGLPWQSAIPATRKFGQYQDLLPAKLEKNAFSIMFASALIDDKLLTTHVREV